MRSIPHPHVQGQTGYCKAAALRCISRIGKFSGTWAARDIYFKTDDSEDDAA
jgi:hypothetical protein